MFNRILLVSLIWWRWLAMGLTDRCIR